MFLVKVGGFQKGLSSFEFFFWQKIPLWSLWEKNQPQGGGFKYFLFSPLFGEDSHFDEPIFQRG